METIEEETENQLTLSLSVHIPPPFKLPPPSMLRLENHVSCQRALYTFLGEENSEWYQYWADEYLAVNTRSCEHEKLCDPAVYRLFTCKTDDCEEKSWTSQGLCT